MDVGVIETILQRDSLRVPNEDWLLSLIFELGSQHHGLIRYIRFEFLNSESIDFFFDTMSIDELDYEIWERMRNRMRHRMVYDRDELFNSRFMDHVTRMPDSPWSGLISHLGELCSGNVHERGVIEITCSSNSRKHCWDVVNYDWNNYWFTNDSPNSWIQFDFKDWVVSLTHYSLKSDGDNGWHLLKWEVCGSQDGNTWILLDRRHTTDLNGRYITKLFSCITGRDYARFYRYIRLQQTGKDSSGHYYLSLANIEFFGSMMKSANTGMTIAMN
jgi:hypothetical protein